MTPRKPIGVLRSAVASASVVRLTGAMLFFSGPCVLAQAANADRSTIDIGTSIAISRDDPTTPLGETWLAVNPRDSTNMIAVSMAFPKVGRWASVMYYTRDAGSTWHRVTHGSSHDEYFWGADPHIQFGPDGTAYYTDLEWGVVGPADFHQEMASGGVPLNVYMFRSTDGGRSWSDPIALDGVDHSCVAIDRSQSKYTGRVYVAYTTAMTDAQGKGTEAIGFAYSDDDGRTYQQRVFSPPVVPFRDRIRAGPSPTDLLVTPDGTLVLAYVYDLDGRPSAEHPQGLEQQTWTMSSADGGRTFTEPHLVRTSSFSEAQVDSSKVDYWPRLAVDASHGPNRGRLYITNESNSDSGVRINVLTSSDAGRTWSDPVRVDDGNALTTANSPGIAVTDGGILGVAWYDRRADPKNNCFQEYFSASLDGGTTFLPNRVVREPPTCTLQRGNWQPNVSQSVDVSRGTYSLSLSSPGLRFINGGETHGIVAVGRDGFELAWIDGESGVMQLAATRVRVTAPALGPDIGDLVEVQTTRPTLDIDAKTASMQIVATNRSHLPLVAPLTLVVSRMQSIFGGLQALNADNGLPGIGATWHLSAGVSDAPLAVGASTRPLVLQFKFSKAPASSQDSPAFLQFHIFERSH